MKRAPLAASLSSPSGAEHKSKKLKTSGSPSIVASEAHMDTDEGEWERVGKRKAIACKRALRFSTKLMLKAA